MSVVQLHRVHYVTKIENLFDKSKKSITINS